MSSKPPSASDLEESWTRAFAAWKDERYSEAEPFFAKVLPFIDGHWNAPHFLSCFAHTLEMNGKLDEAYQLRLRVVEAALKSDDPDSSEINVARRGLREFLFRCKRYSDALAAIQPSIDQPSESRWLLLQLAAQIYYRQRLFPQALPASAGCMIASHAHRRGG
jgi:tetratricopeptide (TPR) repeat protein